MAKITYFSDLRTSFLFPGTWILHLNNVDNGTSKDLVGANISADPHNVIKKDQIFSIFYFVFNEDTITSEEPGYMLKIKLFSKIYLKNLFSKIYLKNLFSKIYPALNLHRGKTNAMLRIQARD